jgi:molybdopterin molybdotransferase
MNTPLRTVEEHARRVVALVEPLPVEVVGLEAAVGRPLAADVVARVAVPPFDNAAMDGYAVRLDDVRGDDVRLDDARGDDVRGSGDSVADGRPTVTLHVVAESAAGPVSAGSARRIGPDEAVRIMTGAPIPEGCDAVVPVERTSTVRFTPGSPAGGPAPVERDVAVPRLGPDDRTHVRRRGEDVREGDVVGRAGQIVTPALAALAASTGHGVLPVRRVPLVAVVSTGSELVPAGEPLAPGQIPDSNSVLLAAAAREAGARVERIGGVPDTADDLAESLDAAVRAGADLVVTAGGVSAGAHDVVRALLGPVGPGAGTRTGAGSGVGASDVDVAAVGMQPGRPQALARWRSVPWVAVPGNPVSAAVSFELFVRPAIDRLRGEGSSAPAGEPRTVAEGWRSPVAREQVLPVTADDDGRVRPAGRNSHLLSGLARADGLALVPADVVDVRTGDVVRVLRIGGRR